MHKTGKRHKNEEKTGERGPNNGTIETSAMNMNEDPDLSVKDKK